GANGGARLRRVGREGRPRPVAGGRARPQAAHALGSGGPAAAGVVAADRLPPPRRGPAVAAPRLLGRAGTRPPLAVAPGAGNAPRARASPHGPRRGTHPVPAPHAGPGDGPAARRTWAGRVSR